jgi:Zn-dependent peptidase ImmA (M78 family)
MKHSRREQINGLADSVRSACALATPIDVEHAVSKLGGELCFADDADFEAKIERIDSYFRITLGQPSADTRRRFSVAHELGHLFLHMGYLVDDAKWASSEPYIDSVYYRYGYSTEEYEANEFAAALLMPRNEFLGQAARHRDKRQYLIDEIASHFQVSREAAVNRGRWLGLFAWE